MRKINIYTNEDETILECNIEEFLFKCVKIEDSCWVIDCETIQSPIFRNKEAPTIHEVSNIIHSIIENKYPNKYDKNIIIKGEKECTCSSLDYFRHGCICGVL